MWLAVNHNTSITSADEFDVRSVLHGKVNLAAVNHSCEIHEAINGCKNLKIIKALRKCEYLEMTS